MKKTCRSILSIAALAILANSTYALNIPNASFAGSEHYFIGSNIKLRFEQNDTGQTGTPLHLPNSLVMTDAQLIPMGDLYGVPDAAVSKGKDNTEREARFLSAFNTLAQKTDSVTEAPKLIAVIEHEEQVILDAIKSGKKPEDAYKELGYDTSRQYNCITGGGCSPDDWWLTPGRYMDLAEQNYDHFGDNAVLAYTTGHHLAVREAASAHQSHNTQRLELAYAMDAFACHFLSDRFSAGHVRTPRVELPDNTTPSVVGSLLSGYMHNEENAFGLHVHNKRGDVWVAFGDRSYFSDKDDENAALVIEAVQTSADEVFSAYSTGSTASADAATNLVPIPDEIGDNVNLDISPLFYWDAKSKKVFRREDMTNVYDKHWTDSWWGWSTLVELRKERGTTPDFASALYNSKYRDQAIKDGLLQDK